VIRIARNIKRKDTIMAAAKKKRNRQSLPRLMTKAALRSAASRAIGDLLNLLLDGVAEIATKAAKK
jgi:hypothetical protein